MEVIAKAIHEDSRPGSYRDSWIANIAMPIWDQRGNLDLNSVDDCNEMAEILLEHFFGPLAAGVSEPLSGAKQACPPFQRSSNDTF